MSRLSRWSQRKQAVTAPEPAAEPRPRSDTASRADTAPPDAASSPITAALTPAEAPADPQAPQTPNAVAAEPAPGALDATLPAPETLPPGSDIKAYLASGVSTELRRRALRRLFAADHYAVRDGLDVYDEDYRQTLKPLAGELAERLRRWTRPEPESDDEATAGEPPVAEPSQNPGQPITDSDPPASDSPHNHTEAADASTVPSHADETRSRHSTKGQVANSPDPVDNKQGSAVNQALGDSSAGSAIIRK